MKRLQQGLVVLDDVLARWTDLTTDCNYGEIRRELLVAENKQALLEAATQTSKSGTMVTVCKSTGRLVREALGADQSPLNNIVKLLEKPAIVDRLPDDAAFEAFLKASELLQQALSGADAAAGLAASDFSAQTTFKRGETPSTPNLDAAKGLVTEARDALRQVCSLVS